MVKWTKRAVIGELEADVLGYFVGVFKRGFEVGAGLEERAISREANICTMLNDVQYSVDEAAVWVLGEVVRPGKRVESR